MYIIYTYFFHHVFVSDNSNDALSPADDPAVDSQTALVEVTTTIDAPPNVQIDAITKAATNKTASFGAAISKPTITIFKEAPLTPSEKNFHPLQFDEESQVAIDTDDTIQSDEEGPFSWQKSTVISCDKGNYDICF